jgi:hypothetical protein
MQDSIERIVDHALPVSAGLAAAGAVAGYLGTVIPTTILFLASGLLLMVKAGRKDASAAE